MKGEDKGRERGWKEKKRMKGGDRMREIGRRKWIEKEREDKGRR